MGYSLGFFSQNHLFALIAMIPYWLTPYWPNPTNIST
jgi:hypothetical protein